MPDSTKVNSSISKVFALLDRVPSINEYETQKKSKLALDSTELISNGLTISP